MPYDQYNQMPQYGDPPAMGGKGGSQPSMGGKGGGTPQQPPMNRYGAPSGYQQTSMGGKGGSGVDPGLFASLLGSGISGYGMYDQNKTPPQFNPQPGGGSTTPSTPLPPEAQPYNPMTNRGGYQPQPWQQSFFGALGLAQPQGYVNPPGFDPKNPSKLGPTTPGSMTGVAGPGPQPEPIASNFPMPGVQLHDGHIWDNPTGGGSGPDSIIMDDTYNFRTGRYPWEMPSSTGGHWNGGSSGSGSFGPDEFGSTGGSQGWTGQNNIGKPSPGWAGSTATKAPPVGRTTGSSTGPFNTTSGANADNPTGAGVTRHIDPVTGRWVAGPGPGATGQSRSRRPAWTPYYGQGRNYGTESNPLVPMTSWGTPTQYSGPRSFNAQAIRGMTAEDFGDAAIANARRWSNKDWYSSVAQAKAAQGWQPGQPLRVHSRSPLGRRLRQGQRKNEMIEDQFGSLKAFYEAGRPPIWQKNFDMDAWMAAREGRP